MIRTLGFATLVVVHRAPVNGPRLVDARVWPIQRLWHIRGSLQIHCGNSLHSSLRNAELTLRFGSTNVNATRLASSPNRKGHPDEEDTGKCGDARALGAAVQ